jgi:hypothetical protein
VRKSQGSYDQNPTPKYFVEFDKAGHLTWTNLTSTAHDDIVAYSVAFMNHYVKGELADPLLPHARAGVAWLRYASELGTNGGGAAATEQRLFVRPRPVAAVVASSYRTAAITTA